MASLMPMGPVASTGAALGTSPSTSDMLRSSIVPNTANIQSQILSNCDILIFASDSNFNMVSTCGNGVKSFQSMTARILAIIELAGQQVMATNATAMRIDSSTSKLDRAQ